MKSSVLRSARLVLAAWLGAALSSGCVLGYGRCLLLEPVKSHLTGKVHYRKFPVTGSGVDEVPILALDKTAYIYSPGTSKQCQSAYDVQLLPITDLPDNIHEGSRVEVEGKLALNADAHHHTRFTMSVDTIRILK